MQHLHLKFNALASVNSPQSIFIKFLKPIKYIIAINFNRMNSLLSKAVACLEIMNLKSSITHKKTFRDPHETCKLQ